MHTSLELSPWQPIQLEVVSRIIIVMYSLCSHTYLIAFLTPTHIALIVAASSGLDGYIKLWNLENGKPLKSIDGGPGNVVL